MNRPIYVIPEAVDELQALNRSTNVAGLSLALLAMVQLRASQINGCSGCV